MAASKLFAEPDARVTVMIYLLLAASPAVNTLMPIAFVPTAKEIGAETVPEATIAPPTWISEEESAAVGVKVIEVSAVHHAISIVYCILAECRA